MSIQARFVSVAVLLAVFSGSAARAEVFSPLATSVHDIRNHLKEEGADTSKSCLDEYLSRHDQLVRRMALGSLGVIGDPVATAGGALAGGLIGAASTTGEAGLAAAVGGMVLGGGAIAIVGTTTLVAGEAVGLARLLETNRMIKTVYEAHVGQGKEVGSFIKKLRKHERKQVQNLSDADIMAEIVALDEQGALCNGKLVSAHRLGKGKKLRQVLANEHELIKAIAR